MQAGARCEEPRRKRRDFFQGKSSFGAIVLKTLFAIPPRLQTGASWLFPMNAIVKATQTWLDHVGQRLSPNRRRWLYVFVGWRLLLCLVNLTKRNRREILTVVLKSEDRFGETKMLLDWVFFNHRWEELAPPLTPTIHL